MAIKRSASAQWQGSLQEGTGYISSQSGALENIAFGFKTRFEDQPGSNPEELIASAHAGCFSMALSGMLSEQNLTPESIHTEATTIMEKQGEGFAITTIELKTRAKVPGADKDSFEKAAQSAKDNCPISNLFNAEIKLDAQLTED